MQWLVSYRDGNVVCRYMLASHCMYLSLSDFRARVVVYILVSQNIMHHTHRKGEGSHTHDRVSYIGESIHLPVDNGGRTTFPPKHPRTTYGYTDVHLISIVGE